MEGKLILSENSGRYVIDDGEEGRELSTGMPIEIYAGRLVWISGHVQYGYNLYATQGHAIRKPDTPPPSIAGYYLFTGAEEKLGLCVGMTVRIP